MKKLLKTFSLNLIFSFSLVILFILIKDQVSNYIKFLRESSSKLLDLQTSLANNITSNLPDLQSSIDLMTKSTTKFFLMQYFVIPLTLFVLWILFQGLIFYLLSNQKDIKKYLIKFTLTTLPFYIVFLLLVRFVFVLIPILFFILFIILIYPLLLLYLDKLKYAFKIKLILLYLLLLFLLFFYFIFSILTIISMSSFVTVIIPLVILIIITLLISSLEIYFVKTSNSY